MMLTIFKAIVFYFKNAIETVKSIRLTVRVVYIFHPHLVIYQKFIFISSCRQHWDLYFP